LQIFSLSFSAHFAFVPFVSRSWFRSIEIPNFFSRLQLVYQCLPVADLKVKH
jgi:hypothetical protein